MLPSPAIEALARTVEGTGLVEPRSSGVVLVSGGADSACAAAASAPASDPVHFKHTPGWSFNSTWSALRSAPRGQARRHGTELSARAYAPAWARDGDTQVPPPGNDDGCMATTPTEQITITLKSAQGNVIGARLVRYGDRFGKDFQYTHDSAVPVIEFRLGGDGCGLPLGILDAHAQLRTAFFKNYRVMVEGALTASSQRLLTMRA